MRVVRFGVPEEDFVHRHIAGQHEGVQSRGLYRPRAVHILRVLRDDLPGFGDCGE